MGSEKERFGDYYQKVLDLYCDYCNDNLVRKFASESGFSNSDIVDKAIKQTNKISKMCNAKLEEPYAKVPVFNKHDKLDALFDEVM